MNYLTNFYKNIPSRMKYSFSCAFIVSMLVHLFILTNNLINHDSMYRFYDPQNMGESGRFTLTYLAGISSYFDLHYFNGLLAMLFVALTVMLLVELFHVESKLLIFIMALLYAAYPSVSAVLAYMFTADAYLLGNLLTTLAVYIIFKRNKGWLATVVAAILVYIALGTYQINLAYFVTLVLVVFIAENLREDKIGWRKYFHSAFAVVAGLAAYVVHFKWYEKVYGMNQYNGISNSGDISLETIRIANELAMEEFKFFFFNSFAGMQLFEKLNYVYLIATGVFLIVYFVARRTKIVNIVCIAVTIFVLPYIAHLMYYISNDAVFHMLMKQHFVFVFFIGVVLVELWKDALAKWKQAFTLGMLALVFVVGFNNAIITNIYYEKYDDLNKQTHALLTQVVHDIRSLDGYSTELPVYLAGFPSAGLSIAPRYDLRTPFNVGMNSRIVYDHGSAYNYIYNEIGLKNASVMPIAEFIERNKEEIDALPVWPNRDSVQIIDGTIVVQFGPGY